MGASPAIELERGLDVGCGVVMVRAVGGECGADMYGSEAKEAAAGSLVGMGCLQVDGEECGVSWKMSGGGVGKW